MPVTNNIQPGYHVRNKPTTWHAINRNFLQHWVYKTFNSYSGDFPDTCSLFTHQHVVKDFLQPDSPYRGLLLYHGTGVGKSRESIAIAEVLSSAYKVTVLLPASLSANYIDEIQACGNAAYCTTGKWKFISRQDDNFKEHERVATSWGVSAQSIKRNGGIWIRDATDMKGSNFKTLDDNAQAQVRLQIQDMIHARYTFVHYNGLQERHIKDMKESHKEGSSPFDNQVVIVDEVHNLVSRISNGRYIATSLYKMILTAKNAKILLLSGTPIINKPVELGIIANMVRGYMRQIEIYFPQIKPNQWESLEKWLQNSKSVDYYEADRVRNTLSVYPLVSGYEWANKSQFLISKSKSQVDFKKELLDFLQGLHINVNIEKNIKEVPTLLLPDNEKEFDSTFVDYKVLSKSVDKSPIINENLLSRRLQGVISYFESYSRAQFASVSPLQIIKVQMSDEAFKTYMMVRQEEIAKEAKARDRQRQGRTEINNGNIYRSFTRAMCNFTFPPRIKRVFPSTLRMMKEEVDDDSFGVFNEDSKTKSKKASKQTDDFKVKYQEQLENAMKELKKQGDTFLQGEGLGIWGPKYVALLDNVHKLNRPSLVYSQFRTVEGLGILQLVLQQAGYTEFKIYKNEHGEWDTDMTKDEWRKPKYVAFTGDKERSNLIKAAFNNDFTTLPPKLRKALTSLNGNKTLTNLRGEVIRILMITQSGAEGISLRNVRQVHILEPYWNEIRVKQVIGRAVRAGSHLGLPEDERHVDVYLYQTEFSDAQKAHKKVIVGERGQTSDEYIYSIALKKSKITNTLLDVMKKSAVDCLIHKNAHGLDTCSSYPKNFGEPIEGVLYSYKGISEDPSDETLYKQMKQESGKRRIGFIRCWKNENKDVVRIPYYKDNSQALDPIKFQSGLYEVVGVVVNDEGIPRVVKFDS